MEAKRYSTSTNFAFAESDLIFLRVPTQDIIIISSVKAATELLDKRSLNCSDRRQSVVLEL